MKIGKCEFNKISLNQEFDYKKLYSDSRGSVHKEIYETLLSGCLEKGIIKVSKYEFGKISDNQYFDLLDEKGKKVYKMRKLLKAYHQERDAELIPLLYLMKESFPEYEITDNMISSASILTNYKNVKIMHRLGDGNAVARIYIQDTDDVILTTNDEIENLIDCLEKVVTKVVVIGTEMLSEEISLIAYLVEKDNRFNELKNKAENFGIDKLFG